jgi:hypothetical protein
LYLSSKELYDAPIRFISNHHTTLQGFEIFESPNYVLGLGATLMNEVRDNDARQAKAVALFLQQSLTIFWLCHPQSSILSVPSTLILLPQAMNSHMQTWSRVQVSSSSLDTQPEPLEEELATRLLAHLPLAQHSAIGSREERSVDTFLLIRRSQARRKMAASISAMYV